MRRTHRGRLVAASLLVTLLGVACDAEPASAPYAFVDQAWCADADGRIDLTTHQGHDAPLAMVDARPLPADQFELDEDDLRARCARWWRLTAADSLCEVALTDAAVRARHRAGTVTEVVETARPPAPGTPLVVRGRVDCTRLEPVIAPGDASFDGQLEALESRRWTATQRLATARRVAAELRSSGRGCRTPDQARAVAAATLEELPSTWGSLEELPGEGEPGHAHLCAEVALDRAGVVVVRWGAVERPGSIREGDDRPRR